MVNIKRFIDRVSTMDNKGGRDFVMPASEARALRDEIAKLLADRVEGVQRSAGQEEVITVEVSGGKW
jgi:hypothetical protein